jgi:hypothetical protein
VVFYHIDRRLLRSVARIEFSPRCEFWDGKEWSVYWNPGRVRDEAVPVDRLGAAALLRETRRERAGLPELSDWEALRVLDAPGRRDSKSKM